MARRCVKWVSAGRGRKRKGSRGKKHCPYGRVKSGPRKGRCRLHRPKPYAKLARLARQGRGIAYGTYRRRRRRRR